MSGTRLKFLAASFSITVGVVLPLLVYHLCRAAWEARNECLRRQAGQLAELSVENQRLSNRVFQAASSRLSEAQFLELLRLRAGIGRLRQAAGEMTKLQAINQRLHARTADPNPQAPTDAQAAPDPAKIQAYWPKSQLAFASYSDPASAVQTVLWAMSQGDPESLAASMTPEAKNAIMGENGFKNRTREEEFAHVTRAFADSLSPSIGFYLIGQTFKSDDQASLEVFFAGEGRTRRFDLRKIDGNWKFQNLGDCLSP